nr:disease resistance protein rpp8 [Quercus suber]
MSSTTPSPLRFPLPQVLHSHNFSFRFGEISLNQAAVPRPPPHRQTSVSNLIYSNKGTLPVLEFLSIGHCPELKVVPSGIQHLKNLKELGFWGMPKEFEESLDPEQGLHYWIVEHVPVIILFRKVNNLVLHNNVNSNLLA